MVARPIGVVAVIVPWNWPPALMSVRLAEALSTGNTVVAKPAPTTPLTALLLGECAADVLPPGVFNTLVDANDLGAALTAHPDVAKVSFTGSTATGRKVMSAAAATLKRLTLELGGNDAALLLDDVDLDDVAPKIFQAATYNAGQVCMAAKRIYVPRRLADGLCDRLAALAQSAVVGDGMDPATQIGPIQNRMQFDKLRELCDDSVLHGKVLAGGVVLNRPGYFISPMIVRDLPERARLVREEQFGPLIPVLPYDSVDEAVGRANASEFGLAGTVWGMILAFTSLGESGGQAGPSDLSLGISKALFHTLLGLTLAIPCLFVFGFYRSIVDRICTRGMVVCSQLIEALPADDDADGSIPPSFEAKPPSRVPASV